MAVTRRPSGFSATRRPARAPAGRRRPRSGGFSQPGNRDRWARSGPFEPGRTRSDAVELSRTRSNSVEPGRTGSAPKAGRDRSPRPRRGGEGSGTVPRGPRESPGGPQTPGTRPGRTRGPRSRGGPTSAAPGPTTGRRRTGTGRVPPDAGRGVPRFVTVAGRAFPWPGAGARTARLAGFLRSDRAALWVLDPVVVPRRGAGVPLRDAPLGAGLARRHPGDQRPDRVPGAAALGRRLRRPTAPDGGAAGNWEQREEACREACSSGTGAKPGDAAPLTHSLKGNPRCPTPNGPS